MKEKQKLKHEIRGEFPMHVKRPTLSMPHLAFTLFAVFAHCVAIAQQGPVIATVININGRLDYRENPSAQWKPAKKADALYQGYHLKTDTGNKAMILYNATKARVLMNENTQIEIQAQAPSTGNKPSRDRTRLMMGEIFSKITSGSYEVETPSSVASVRGTWFDSKYSLETETATYLVLENSVELMNQLGSVLLRQYQTADVRLNQAPGTPQTLSQNDAEKRTSWIEGVEPKWRLNMVPEGGNTHETGGIFNIGLSLLDLKTLRLDNSASIELRSFAASSDIIEFSTDNGKTWTNSPLVRILNGFAALQARAKSEGQVSITAEADDTEPATIDIIVARVKDKRQIEILFTDPKNGNQKTLILELEEK